MASFQRINHSFYGNILTFGNNDVISRCVSAGHIWDANIGENFAKYYVPGTDFIDIGANMGLLTLHLMMKHTNLEGGKGHLFECNPQVAAICAENTRKYTDIIVYTAAVGDKVGMACFALLDFNTHENIGGNGVGDDQSKFRVPIVSLDSLDFPNKVSIIKIDVEGNEKNVVAGMTQLISQHRPVIILEIYGGTSFERANDDQKLFIVGLIDIVTNMGYNFQRICYSDYLFTPKERSEDVK